MKNLARKPRTRSWTSNRDRSRKARIEIHPKGEISFSNIQESGNGFPEITRRVDKAYLLHLLYEGAIDYLTKARQAARMEEIGAMAGHINRALNILHELSRSVKISAGDELADQLGKLYLFWIKSINRVKHLGDIRVLDEVVKMITAVRELCPVQTPVLEKMVQAI